MVPPPVEIHWRILEYNNIGIHKKTGYSVYSKTPYYKLPKKIQKQVTPTPIKPKRVYRIGLHQTNHGSSHKGRHLPFRITMKYWRHHKGKKEPWFTKKDYSIADTFFYLSEGYWKEQGYEFTRLGNTLHDEKLDNDFEVRKLGVRYLEWELYTGQEDWEGKSTLWRYVRHKDMISITLKCIKDDLGVYKEGELKTLD